MTANARMRCPMFRVIAVMAAAMVSIGVQVAKAAPPLKGSLYGIGFPDVLVSADPVSGTLTPIVSLAGTGPNPFIPALAADSKPPDLVALVLTCTSCPNAKGGGGPVFWQLAQINTETRSVSVSPVLQRSLAYAVAVDAQSRQIWALPDCFDSGCAVQTVVQVDPSTGIERDVATIPALATLDSFITLAPKSHMLSMVIRGQLFRMDTRSAVVTAGPNIGFITGFAADPGDGRLFATLGYPAPRVVQIDPTTGSHLVLASFNGIDLASPTIDPRTHTLFAAELVNVGGLTQSEIVAVDDRTGAVTEGSPVNTNFGRLAFQQTR